MFKTTSCACHATTTTYGVTGFFLFNLDKQKTALVKAEGASVSHLRYFKLLLV